MNVAHRRRSSRVCRSLVGIVACAGLMVAPTSLAAPDHDEHPAGHSPASAPAPAPAAPATPAAPGAKPATKSPAAGERARPRTPSGTPSGTPAAAGPASSRTATAPGGTSEPAEPAAAPKSRTERSGASKPAEVAAEPVDADRALTLLSEGNARWVAGEAQNPSTDAARRSNTAEKGQKPFVTVLTCADSRIPIERVFDRGVGEVFVVRVAGNTAGPSESGTIEYGVSHLNTPLLVVMGHTRCGAVAVAASGAELHGALGSLVDRIRPAVERARRANPGLDQDELTRMAITENIWQGMFDLLRTSDELRSVVTSGRVRLVGAVYDISSGKVDWLGQHPWQTELLTALNTDQPAPAHAAGNTPSGKQTPAAPNQPAGVPAHAGVADDHGQ